MDRRSNYQDYNRVCFYLLTFQLVEDVCPAADLRVVEQTDELPQWAPAILNQTVLLGVDSVDGEASKQPDDWIPAPSGLSLIQDCIRPSVVSVPTGIGEAIIEGIQEFVRKYPQLEILDFVIMPDHIHIAVYVKERLDLGLSWYVTQLKGKCSTAAWRRNPDSGLAKTRTGLFQKGYNDVIIDDSRHLKTSVDYIRRNPERLYIMRQYPQYFHNTVRLAIGMSVHDAYGNFLLLRHPDKQVVIVSSKDRQEEAERKRSLWYETARRGGVLVGAFINPKEREVKDRCVELGARIIKISRQGFPERYKPRGGDIDLCAAGRYLEIGLMAYRPGKDRVSRLECQTMNEYAKQVAALTPDTAMRILTASQPK